MFNNYLKKFNIYLFYMTKQMYTSCCYNKCKKKRILVITSMCKCEQAFCRKHRLKHDCSFDYIAEHKQKLKEKCPLVQKAKIEKI